MALRSSDISPFRIAKPLKHVVSDKFAATGHCFLLWINVPRSQNLKECFRSITEP